LNHLDLNNYHSKYKKNKHPKLITEIGESNENSKIDLELKIDKKISST
jgi:hypothetical protein